MVGSSTKSYVRVCRCEVASKDLKHALNMFSAGNSIGQCLEYHRLSAVAGLQSIITCIAYPVSQRVKLTDKNAETTTTLKRLQYSPRTKSTAQNTFIRPSLPSLLPILRRPDSRSFRLQFRISREWEITHCELGPGGFSSGESVSERLLRCSGHGEAE